MKILTHNVTSLTKARLIDVCKLGVKSDADAICLQETRHIRRNLAWAKSIAKQYGYHLAFSIPPPSGSRTSTTEGGTAILWRDVGLGKASIIDMPTPSHRVLAVSWANATIINFYGFASRPDHEWTAGVFAWSSDLNRPNTFMIGDFNWKSSFDDYLPLDWVVTDSSMPTTIDGSRPTRCVGSSEATKVTSTFVAGIPHHMAVTYEVNVSASAPRQAMRLRKCAKFSWIKQTCSEEELDEIQKDVDLVAPKLDDSASILQRWRRWHARAEQAWWLCKVFVILL